MIHLFINWLLDIKVCLKGNLVAYLFSFDVLTFSPAGKFRGWIQDKELQGTLDFPSFNPGPWREKGSGQWAVGRVVD